MHTPTKNTHEKSIICMMHSRLSHKSQSIYNTKDVSYICHIYTKTHDIKTIFFNWFGAWVLNLLNGWVGK